MPHVLAPQATASHLISSLLTSNFLLFGRWEIFFLRDRTELLEVHTFSHWFGTFITFIGWEAITLVRRTWCIITYEWASSVCVRKVHLLLMINVWNSLKDRNPAFLCQYIKRICILEWVHLLHCKKVHQQHQGYCCPTVCMYFVCVTLVVLVECMQKRGCISQMCLYLSCSCKSSDVAVLKVTVLTRSCWHDHNGSLTLSINMSLVALRPAFSGIKMVKTSVFSVLEQLICVCLSVFMCVFVHTSVSPTIREAGRTSQHRRTSKMSRFSMLIKNLRGETLVCTIGKNKMLHVCLRVCFVQRW